MFIQVTDGQIEILSYRKPTCAVGDASDFVAAVFYKDNNIVCDESPGELYTTLKLWLITGRNAQYQATIEFLVNNILKHHLTHEQRRDANYAMHERYYNS